MMPLALLLIVGSLLGCVASGDVTQADEVASATYNESIWKVQLEGITSSTITAEDFAVIMDNANQEGVSRTLSVERKGVSASYEGIGLKDLISTIHAQEFDSYTADYGNLWESEYEITLMASDGYAVSFTSSELDANDLVFYDKKDGEAIQPGTIGTDISSKYFIKDLTEIELRFSKLAREVVQEEIFLQLDINGEKTILSLSELRKSPYFMVGKGGYTTSAGTYYEENYGGIRLADFIDSFVEMTDSGSITLRATDGYAMSYAYSDMRSTDNGIWLLAFEVDGDLLGAETGPFRGVRVAEAADSPIPNIDGHSSPKMVNVVEISQEVFNDFSLVIHGKMDAELDRSTIQAGIQCSAHKTTVSYLDKKSGQIEQYTGMPLFALLAYGDDPLHAPHKQTDKIIVSYKKETAQAGYQVKIIAGDGYSIVLDSKELDGNFDVILAMYMDKKELSGGDWPLKLVWDQNAEVIPEGIKAVKNVAALELLF